MAEAALRLELIRLARKGIGRVSPNPLVGALLVKNNRIVGRGYHPYFGGPHAEVMAIEVAGRRAKGAKLYVSLEPCAHFGKTPPCTELIKSKGISAVWVGMTDPNPLVAGEGVARLRKAGITVEIAEGSEFAVLNRPYIRFMTTNMPWVILKNALTLDGRINDRPLNLSSEKSRRLVHRWRAAYDAVGVGVNTVIRDNPILNVRLIKAPGREPLRVIFDSQGRTPKTAELFKNQGGEVVVLTTAQAPKEKLARLEAAGATVISVASKDGKVDLKAALKKLAAEKNVTSLLIEGGTTLNAALLKAKLANELAFFITPNLWGEGKGIPVIGSVGKVQPHLINVKTRRFDSDVLISGEIKYS